MHFYKILSPYFAAKKAKYYTFQKCDIKLVNFSPSIMSFFILVDKILIHRILLKVFLNIVFYSYI
jgi:hypothetical protein